jgi:hypothetical protein
VGVSRRKISVFTALVSALVILFLEIGYPNPNPNNNNHETEIRNKNPMNHMAQTESESGFVYSS